MAYDSYENTYKESDPWQQDQNRLQTQGGPYSDPRWSDGTWGTRPQQTTTPDQPTAKDYSGWGQFMPQGLDMGKVEGGHDSPKYQIARIQSHFDTRKSVHGRSG